MAFFDFIANVNYIRTIFLFMRNKIPARPALHRGFDNSISNLNTKIGALSLMKTKLTISIQSKWKLTQI